MCSCVWLKHGEGLPSSIYCLQWCLQLGWRGKKKCLQKVAFSGWDQSYKRSWNCKMFILSILLALVKVLLLMGQNLISKVIKIVIIWFISEEIVSLKARLHLINNNLRLQSVQIWILTLFNHRLSSMLGFSQNCQTLSCSAFRSNLQGKALCHFVQCKSAILSFVWTCIMV